MANDMRVILDKLNDLIALDIDAVSAYQSAIARIGSMPIRERLLEFQKDHERHVADLSQVVRNFDGTPRTRPDVKGFVLKAFTAITSMMGDEAALRAMRGNEEITNRVYRNALEERWPASVHTLIQRNFEDEQRHLMVIKDLIAERSMEEVAPA